MGNSHSSQFPYEENLNLAFKFSFASFQLRKGGIDCTMRFITERFRNDDGRVIVSIELQSLNEDFTIRFEFFADVLLSLFHKREN